MAIAVCSVKNISRGQGRSAVAAAAYRSGEMIRSERDGMVHDYTRKSGVVYADILAPSGAPVWMYYRSALWNAAEGMERRSDARLAKEVMVALPKELTLEQNIEAAKAFAQTFVDDGMVADVSVHASDKNNLHAHIMLATRPIDGDGFSKKKNREWDAKETLIKWRKEYEQIMNYYLELYGHEERIDVRSYADQGIDKIPSLHLGIAAHHMEQRRIHTVLGDRNREIEELNRQIAAQRKEVDYLKSEVAQEQARNQETLAKQDTEAQEPSEPETASDRYNRLIEHYMRASQSVQETSEALQYVLTEKGIRDLEEQGKNIEAARERLRQQTGEPDRPVHHTPVGDEKQRRVEDYNRLYEVAREGAADKPPHHTRGDEPAQDRREHYDSLYAIPQQPDQEPSWYHPQGEEPSRKQDLDFDEIYVHHSRTVREQERERDKDDDLNRKK